MVNPRLTFWLALGLALGLGLALTGIPQVVNADVFLPLLLIDERQEGIPRVPTAETPLPRPSPTEPQATTTAPVDTPVATPTEGETLTPTSESPPETATVTPTPTRRPASGRITGRCTVRGQPLFEGYGLPPYPQLQLRRQVGGLWERVANARTDAEGRFVFQDPPALEPGELYQVWWVNEDSEESAGDWTLLGRWWSRLIPQFSDGSEVDVGVFELADLTYLSPCNDCHQTPPITYKWRTRDHGTDIYRWSLHRRCGDVADKLNRSFRTESLGHRDSYTTGPPPGFQFDQRYCWYIYIEDGQNGTGWPYFEWVTAYLSGANSGSRLGWPRLLKGLWPILGGRWTGDQGVGQGSAATPRGWTSRTP